MTNVFVCYTSIDEGFTTVPDTIGVADSREAAIGLLNEEILQHNKEGMEDDPEEFEPLEMLPEDMQPGFVIKLQDYYTFWFDEFTMNRRIDDDFVRVPHQ